MFLRNVPPLYILPYEPGLQRGDREEVSFPVEGFELDALSM